MGYEDFKKIGRLGCSECYQAFKASLLPLLKRIHGSNAHMGKTPDPEAVKEQKVSSKLHEELEAAKAELAKAIKKEEFEEAAAMRDKVKFLEKKVKDELNKILTDDQKKKLEQGGSGRPGFGRPGTGDGNRPNRQPGQGGRPGGQGGRPRPDGN